jgi:hypothetical protein
MNHFQGTHSGGEEVGFFHPMLMCKAKARHFYVASSSGGGGVGKKRRVEKEEERLDQEKNEPVSIAVILCSP